MVALRHFGLATTLVLLATTVASRADDPPVGRAAQTAARVLDAVRTHDADALAHLAAEKGLDPYAVADVLLARHAEAGGKDAEPVAAARAYAAATRDRVDAAGLVAWVEAWAAWTPEQLAVETRLRRARERVRAALEKDDLGRVLELFRRAEEDVRALPASLSAAQLRHDAGNAQVFADRLEAAVPLLTDDPTTGAPLWPVGRVAALRWLAYALAEGPHPERALDPAAEGRDLALRLGMPKAASFSERRARALHLLGRLAESLAEADAGAQTALAAGEHVVAAMALLAACAALLELGRPLEAIERAERAHREADAAALPELVADALVVEGAARAAAGQLARGLDLAERGVAAWRPLGRPASLAGALYTLGSASRLAGLLERAEAAYREGAPLARAGGDPRAEGRSRRALGDIALNAGRLEDAERELVEARRLFESVGAARDVVRTLGSLGRLVSRRVPGGEGLAPLREAVALAEKRGDDRVLANALVLLADEEVLRGLTAPGREHAERALALAARAEGRAPWAPSSLAILAAVDHGEGRVDRSLDRLWEALELEAASAEGFGAEEAAGARASARQAADRGFGIAAELAHDAVAAFAFADAGRAGTLLREVLQRDQVLAARLPPALVAEERATRERVASARARLAAAARGTASDAEVALARRRLALDDALAERERAVDRFERAGRMDVEIAAPALASVDDVRAALPPHAALVMYVLRPTTAHAIVVTDEATTLHRLGDPTAIERDVEAWLDLAGSPDGPEEALAARLHAELLAPLATAIGKRDRLVVVPDGVLSFLPFSALLRVDGDLRRRLVEDAEVVHVPSATLFVRLAHRGADARPGRGIVALGDPAYGTAAPQGGDRAGATSSPTALPGSRAEVGAIADLFPVDARTVLLGADASAGALERALAAAPGRLRAVHLACHAVVDPAHPRLTGLVLAGDEVWSLFDVASHRADADLVTLSACGTARGRLLHGEGVLGLVYGYFMAGASRVLASDWRVEDASAQELLVRVYEGWIRDGLSPAAALRRAQRERIAAGGPRAHPYHWAAFTLWGPP